jgi:hypothetical protein
MSLNKSGRRGRFRRLSVVTDLSVQVQQIESENVDPHGDVLGPYILTLPPSEILEWEQLLGGDIIGYGLTVDNEGLDVGVDALGTGIGR